MFQIKCFSICFISYFILESNAYDGCDTISGAYYMGKLKFLKTLEKHLELASGTALFLNKRVDLALLTIIASYITPCEAKDEACMKSSAQAAVPHIAAGIPELGVPQADPIIIKDVYFEINTLKVRFTDSNIAGPGKAKILKVTHDTSKQTIKVIVEAPVFITGHYDLQGKLLFFNAVGNGPYKLNTDKVVFNVDLKYKVIVKDGHKYWKITGFEYTYDLVKKVHMTLDNLFGGNEDAAKPILQLLDENWKEVIVELGGPIIKQLVAEYVNIIKKFLLSIPADKLAVY